MAEPGEEGELEGYIDLSVNLDSGIPSPQVTPASFLLLSLSRLPVLCSLSAVGTQLRCC